MAFQLIVRDGGQPSLAFMGQVVWENGFTRMQRLCSWTIDLMLSLYVKTGALKQIPGP